MKLNRTGSNWDRLERNKINENWDIIEGETTSIGNKVGNIIGEITDEAVEKIIDSAKLNWKEPVDTVADLPEEAEEGDTRMVREADPDGLSYVYRYDGENWAKIQAIDATLVNEVDRRLTNQISNISINVADYGIHPGEIDVDSLRNILSLSNVYSVLFPSGVYILNKPLAIDLINDQFWWTNGKVKFIYNSDINSQMLTINVNGFDFEINGGFILDCNKKARSALGIYNNTHSGDRISNTYITGVKINDALLTNQGVGAKSVEIRGNFRNAVVDNFLIKNTNRLQGTGTPGSQGSHAIVFTHYGETSYIKNATVRNTVIDTVSNEEESGSGLDVDCDGVVMLSPRIGEVVVRDAFLRVEECTFIDCKGRSIKSQTHYTEVNNVTFERNNKTITNAVEVDFQTGNGKLNNFKCFYNQEVEGGNPLNTRFTILRTGTSFRNGSSFATSVHNGEIYLNFPTLPGFNIYRVISVTSTENTIIEKVDIDSIGIYGGGNITNFINGDLSGVKEINISNISTNYLYNSLITPYENTEFTSVVNLDNIVNHNGSPDVIDRDQNIEVYSINLKGFKESDLSSRNINKRNATDELLTSKIVANPSNRGGVFAIESNNIVNGGSHTFRVRGTDGGKALYFLSSSYNQNATAVFSSNGSSLLFPLSLTSSSAVVFNEEEQGKLCVFETGNGIKLINNLGSTRSFTLASIG